MQNIQFSINYILRKNLGLLSLRRCDAKTEADDDAPVLRTISEVNLCAAELVPGLCAAAQGNHAKNALGGGFNQFFNRIEGLP
jgi:hypothetical protein